MRPADNHTAIIEFKVDEVDGDSHADYGDGKAHDGCPRGGVPICIYVYLRRRITYEVV